MSGDAGALPECEVKTLLTPNHTAFQVHISGLGRAGIGRSFWEGINTERHEKAPVCCSSSWLTVLHGAT